ncbi:MAG: ABC transporter ATP-binding protein [Candidatus Micrarchaeaceae archaeon]
MYALEVKNIKYSINNTKIIDNISFFVKEGEFSTIIGPSGCGKSTLLRIIAGLIRQDYGSVRICGKKPEEEKIGFVFQEFALFPWLSAIENVEIGTANLDIDEKEKERRCEEWLERFRLSGFEDAYISSLSGGMKQRVGIARALVSDPSVLLMDEPFSSLDELTANSLRHDTLSVLKDSKSLKCVLMVSHNVEEAVEMSDRIIVLSDKPSKVKKILEIKEHYKSRAEKGFLEKVEEIYEALSYS